MPLAEDRDGEHLVQFYDTERFLVDTASEFVASALLAGDAAIVMATATHRSAIEAALRALGVDVAVAGAAGARRSLRGSGRMGLVSGQRHATAPRPEHGVRV